MLHKIAIRLTDAKVRPVQVFGKWLFRKTQSKRKV